MNTEGFAGLDEELEREEKKQESKVASFEEAKKKRKPFHTWTVGGEDHKLKLNASMVVKLEEKYRTNITNLIMADGTPPLSTMLTIAQAAIAPWEHGTNIDKVYGLYNAWVEEGGNQQDFLSKIILPTMAVSGFFTESQAASLMKSIEEAEALS